MQISIKRESESTITKYGISTPFGLSQDDAEKAEETVRLTLSTIWGSEALLLRGLCFLQNGEVDADSVAGESLHHACKTAALAIHKIEAFGEWKFWTE
jgi:hypothetical protein